MTAIPPLLEELSGNTFPGSSGQLSKQKAKWLYELEKAQWGIKQRPQTLSQNPAGSNMAESSNQKNLIPAGTNKLEQEIEVPHVRKPQPTGLVPTNSAPRAGSFNPSVFEEKTIQQTAAFVTGPQLQPNVVTGSDRNPITPAALGISTHPAQRHWDKQHAHLETKDGDVHLWLRDTRMNASQGLELAITLRKRFAELGVKLARFTLNGQPYDHLNSHSQSPVLTR